MCFVSVIPKARGFLLGSNRDEHKDRKAAISPRIFESRQGNLLMPVDGKAGGTWIGLRQDGVAAVLLNGAFFNHIRRPWYRHSRGIIIPEILRAANPFKAFSIYQLDDIEPFTLILVGNALVEWRWDGEKLHQKQHDLGRPLCWSSATLYNESQQGLRENWFMDALRAKTIDDAESLMKWQSTGGLGPKHTDICLEREDGIGTVSTTIVSTVDNKLEMWYEDYLSRGPQVLCLAAPNHCT